MIEYLQAYFDLLRHGEKKPLSRLLRLAEREVDPCLAKRLAIDAGVVLQAAYSGVSGDPPFELAGVNVASSVFKILE